MADETTETTTPATSPLVATEPAAAPAEEPATQPAPKRTITQPFAEFHQVQQELAGADPVVAARTAAEHRAAQQREYGRYVAAVPIDIGGARAFNVGDAVPQSHVSDDGPVLPGQVALRPDAADPTVPEQDAPRPAGNATTEEWRAYAITRGLAPEAVADMGREQLRAELS